MNQAGIALSEEPTVIHEDNLACVSQVATGFIKADRIKHVDLQIFSFTQDLIQSSQLHVNKIESANNIVDMLTKVLPTYMHKRLVYTTSMRSHSELAKTKGCTLFSPGTTFSS